MEIPQPPGVGVKGAIVMLIQLALPIGMIIAISVGLWLLVFTRPSLWSRFADDGEEAKEKGINRALVKK